EDGIRDFHVTGVQTCALPIYFVERQPRGDRRVAKRREFEEDARAAGRFARMRIGFRFSVFGFRQEKKSRDSNRISYRTPKTKNRSEERRAGKEWRAWWVPGQW